MGIPTTHGAQIEDCAVRTPVLTVLARSNNMRSRNRDVYDVHGGLHFVTSTVVGFIPVFEVSQARDVFVDCLRFGQERGDYRLIAWVVMPNHFHLILNRNQEKSISLIIGNLKRYTSRNIRDQLIRLGLHGLIERLRNAAETEPSPDAVLWKPRFDSLVLINEETIRQKIEYIHFNPVRAGLCLSAEEWQYSSARAYAGSGDQLVDLDVGWLSLGY